MLENDLELVGVHWPVSAREGDGAQAVREDGDTNMHRQMFVVIVAITVHVRYGTRPQRSEHSVNAQVRKEQGKRASSRCCRPFPDSEDVSKGMSELNRRIAMSYAV